MLWIVFLHQAVKNVYIHYTQKVHSCKKSFFVIANSNPTQPAFLPFLFLLISLSLSFFLSFLLISHYTSLPSPTLPLPYPIPPSLKSLPTLPCPALSRLSGIITCTQKKKKTNPKRPKKKKTICLFNLSNLASITSLSQSHIFFSGERGRGGGEGGEVLLYLQVPDLKDSDDDDDECWRDDLSFHHSHGFLFGEGGDEGCWLACLLACLHYIL